MISIARGEKEIVFQVKIVLEMIGVEVEAIHKTLRSLSSSKQRMEMEEEKKEKCFFEEGFEGRDEEILWED